MKSSALNQKNTLQQYEISKHTKTQESHTVFDQIVQN